MSNYRNVGYVILARANSTSGWERREPDVGEQFSGLFSIQNVGKTPALNVRFLSATPIVNTVGEVPDDEPKWSQPQIDETNVVFPSDEDLIQRVGIHYEGMSEQEFLEYSNRSKQIFFWARLYYCDVIGRRHWTQIGAVRLFDPDRASGFRIAASSVSPDPGEPNHEDCQNLGTPNP